MDKLLASLPRTIHASLALAVIVFFGLFYQNDGFSFDRLFWSWLTRFFHVVVAIMWIGLLWYFNFVQIPNMGKIPDEQKPAIGKVIAPAALFYFRWAAALTILSGFLLLTLTDFISAKFLEINNGLAPSLKRDAFTSSSSTFETITSASILLSSKIFFLTPLFEAKINFICFFLFLLSLILMQLFPQQTFL